MKKKRFMGFILAGILSTSAMGGTAQGMNVNAEGNQPNYSDATGRLVLDSWIGPLMTDEAYKEYADCGYNRVHFNNTSVHVEGGTSEADFRSLNAQLDTHFTLAEKYGIDVILAMNARNTVRMGRRQIARYPSKMERQRYVLRLYAVRRAFFRIVFVGGKSGNVTTGL